MGGNCAWMAFNVGLISTLSDLDCKPKGFDDEVLQLFWKLNFMETYQKSLNYLSPLVLFSMELIGPLPEYLQLLNSIRKEWVGLDTNPCSREVFLQVKIHQVSYSEDQVL